jgi:hypothetical protein
MRALTVRQPYADAIAFGTKRVENRTRKLPSRYEDEPVLLHAAKDLHASGITAIDLAKVTWSDISQWTDTRSAILAVIRFKGSHRCADVHWCCKPWGQVETRVQAEVWHWEIDHVERLAEPVPATGALGFWTPKDNVLDAVRTQIGQVV